MIKSIKLLRNSTTFKLAVAAGVSFILYELATFLFPILLAIGLAFALYPVSNMFSKITVGQGTYHLSACGGDHPGLYGFWHVYVFCRYFYFAAFVRADQ